MHPPARICRLRFFQQPRLWGEICDLTRRIYGSGIEARAPRRQVGLLGVYPDSVKTVRLYYIHYQLLT